MRNAQVSLLLVRTNTITNDDFPSSDATVSSVCSPTTDTDGATEHVAAPVSNHDVDDENRIELGRTRRLQSLVVPGGHPRLAGTTCEAVRRCRGRACVAPRPRSLRQPIWRGCFDTIRPQCERERSVLCAQWLSPEPTDHERHRTCADGFVGPPHPSAGVGTKSTVDGAPWSLSAVTSSQCVCGSTSKVAQARPREAPWVPARYTLCVRTRREAAHGQGKLPRAKRQKRCKRASV